MKKKNIVYGLLFILAGIVLVLNHLNIFGDVNILNILIAVVLFVISIYGFMENNFFKGLFPLAFIAIIFDNQLGIEKITPWYLLLSTLFVSIGLSIIFQKKIVKKENWNYISENNNYSVIFGETVKYVIDDVENVDVSCTFGEMDIYLDRASFVNAKLQVNINAQFGEVKIFVPKNCRINNKVTTIMAQTSIKGVASEIQSQDVIISGTAVFAEVQIIYI